MFLLYKAKLLFYVCTLFIVFPQLLLAKNHPFKKFTMKTFLEETKALHSADGGVLCVSVVSNWKDKRSEYTHFVKASRSISIKEPNQFWSFGRLRMARPPPAYMKLKEGYFNCFASTKTWKTPFRRSFSMNISQQEISDELSVLKEFQTRAERIPGEATTATDHGVKSQVNLIYRKGQDRGSFELIKTLYRRWNQRFSPFPWSEPKVSVGIIAATDEAAAMEKHGVSILPAMVVTTRFQSIKNNIIHPITYPKMTLTDVDTLLHVSLLPLHHVTEKEFTVEILRPHKRYVPYMVTFYSYWATACKDYMTALQSTADSASDNTIDVRFGVMEIKSASTLFRNTVAEKFPNFTPTAFPFTLLFYPISVHGNVVDIGMHVVDVDFPTPLAMFEQLRSHGLLKSKGDVLEDFLPTGDYVMCSLKEGPMGNQCDVDFLNNTDNTPYKREIAKPKGKFEKPEPVRLSFLGVHYPELAQLHTNLKKERKFEEVPFISEKTWVHLFETSRKAVNPLLVPELPRITVVVFVMENCSSCRQHMGDFLALHKMAELINGNSLYFMDCSANWRFCRELNVSGYPSIRAYKSHDWLSHSECYPLITMKTRGPELYREYHGIMTFQSIATWFARAAASTLTHRGFKNVAKDINKLSDHTQTSALVATVIPKNHWNNSDTAFSYRCMEAVCESLAGQVGCYSVNTKKASAFLYKGVKPVDMVVIEISLHRADGTQVKVIEAGKRLTDTIRHERRNAIHSFHSSHQYSHWPSQRCSDDVVLCGQFVIGYSLDHSRLPVTEMTIHTFHCSQGFIGDADLPVLVAFIRGSDSELHNSSFYQALHEVAVQTYSAVRTVTVDVDEYTHWAAIFVPKNHVADSLNSSSRISDLPSMFHYPRLCIINWGDHYHAAFYPPPNTIVSADSPFKFTVDGIVHFVDEYLAHPTSLLVETDKF